ncbi:MAG: thioredoxin family protein [Campylobacterota bacterium]|nr:thioredoxin family protein [Campylobacterota bacterium]
MNLEELLAKDAAVAVYFSGKECGVCHVLQPKIKKLIQESFPRIAYHSLDAQEHSVLAASLGVLSVPTLLVFFEQKEFIREVRNISIPLLKQKIQRPYTMIFL